MARPDDLARQLEAVSHILPLWKKNLALAREQAGQGGDMIAACFAEIVTRLQRVIPLLAKESDGGLDGRLVCELAGMCEAVRHAQLALSDAEATTQLQQMMGLMLERLEAAMLREQESAGIFQAESAAIQAEIAVMLEALQYHDRFNQIVGHVEQDLDKMHEKLHEVAEAWRHGRPLPEIELEQWLGELERSYSTQEQKTAHHGRANGALTDGDITFF